MLHKAIHCIRQNPAAVKQVSNQEGLEDVQFELTAQATHGSRSVVTHHLGCDHGHGLALSGVDLSRHDATAGFIFRKNQLSQTPARTGSEVSDVVGDLEETDGKSIQRSRSLDDAVM